MRVLITGSRPPEGASIAPEMVAAVRQTVDWCKKKDALIIMGDAEGVDKEAILYASEIGVEHWVFGAYGQMRAATKHGKNYPLRIKFYPARDGVMVGLADRCYAVWDGSSSGTKITFEMAIDLGIETHVWRDGAWRKG